MRQLLWAVALATGWVLSACNSSSTDQLAQARKLIANNDRAAAVVQLKSAIQADPKSGEARLLLGGQLLEGGELSAAEIELRRALELQTPEAKVVPMLARTLLAMGQPRKLVDQFGDTAWPETDATADLKTSMAQAHAALGEMDKARASLGQALKLAPQLESALLLQARLTAMGGDLSGAQKQVESLLAQSPKLADAWVLKGDLLARSVGGDAVQAASARREAYNQALKVQADHLAAHASLVALLLTQQDKAGAQQQFEAMRKALPKHAQTRFFEGQLAQLNGDLPHAREVYQGLLRAAPNNPVLLQSAGAVELRLNAPVQAEVLLSHAVQLAPNVVPVRRLLAQAYLALGQPAKALAALEPLIGKNAPDAEALSLAGQARLMSGESAAATSLFDRAAKAKPGDTRIRTVTALAHLSQGQEGAALAELESTAAVDTGSNADLALISALMQRKNFDGALKAVAAMDKKQPDKPAAAHLKGQVLLLKHDNAGARLAFEQALKRQPSFYPSVASLAALDFFENKPDAAKARFEGVLKTDPKNASAWLALAELAQRKGEGREAVAALLEDAIKASPADLKFRKALIHHHLATGDTKAALVAAQAALAQVPDNYEMLSELGRAQLAARENQQAINTFGRMITLQGKAPQGHLGLAEAQIATNELGAADKSIKRALEVAPDLLDAQRLAVVVAMRQKQPAQSLAMARDMQRTHADHVAGYVAEAEIEASQKHWDPAIAALRKAITKPEPGQAAELLHKVLRLSGKAPEADVMAAQWLKAHPRDVLFLFFLGDVALGQKDLTLAEQRYRAVLAVQPDHALSLNNVAWLMMNQKKPGAMAMAERAVKASPDRAPLLDTLAQTQAAEGQVTKAIETQKRALVLRPDDPFLRLNLASFYVQANEKRLAKTELDRLQALGDRFPKQTEVTALLAKLTTW
jgi:putative PEP-CTERM system TPR-repeat lipoprotein